MAESQYDLYKINKLQQGKCFVRIFTLVGEVSEISLVRCARAISDTSPSCVKIPYTRAFHEVISLLPIVMKQ